MRDLRGTRGELLLPILAVMVLFGIFWVIYVHWCQRVYWRMRMDMAADATALSAAREEAAMLNTIGTYQYLENLLMQKIKVGGKDITHVQASVASTFFEYNAGLQSTAKLYQMAVMNVARIVAKGNGANRSPIPSPLPQHHLKPQADTMNFFYGPILVWRQYCPAAYFVRDWLPRRTAPQPIHQTIWLVGHDDVWEKGKARLWLDVDPGSKLNNGGFPSAQASGWRAMGVQCNFPQFNAKLLPKYFGSWGSDE